MAPDIETPDIETSLDKIDDKLTSIANALYTIAEKLENLDDHGIVSYTNKESKINQKYNP